MMLDYEFSKLNLAIDIMKKHKGSLKVYKDFDKIYKHLKDYNQRKKEPYNALCFYFVGFI